VDQNAVTVVIPARNEEAGLGGVLARVTSLTKQGDIGEVIVVDDGSQDGTEAVARSFRGVQVVSTGAASCGKGSAVARGVLASSFPIIVTLDADLENLKEGLVGSLVSELQGTHGVRLVKACYRDPEVLGRAGGGRVTELVAKPLLERFYPEISWLGSPLAGEAAFYRRDFLKVEVEPGYGFDIGLVIDFVQRWGTQCLAEVQSGQKIHRHQALGPLSVQAREVMAAILDRANVALGESDLGRESVL